MEWVFEVVNPHTLNERGALSWSCGREGGVIGCGADCDWQIEDSGRQVSRHHARVTYSDGACYLTDISRNATAIDAAQTLPSGQRQRVEHGSTYALGGVEIRVRSGTLDSLDNTCPFMEKDFTVHHARCELDPLDVLQAHDQVHDIIDIDGLSSLVNGHGETGKPGYCARVEREYLALPELLPDPSVPAQPMRPDGATGGDSDLFWLRFGDALGIDLRGLDAATRQSMAERVAGLLRQCVSGLREGEWTRKELAAEWGAGLAAGMAQHAHPFEAGNVRSTLVELLDQERESAVSERRIAQTFRDAQAHQVAMLAGCRAMTRALLAHLSPQQLRLQFEREAGWPSLATAGRCWRAYQHHHQVLTQNDHWSEGLLARDFAQAYDEQIRLINTLHSHLPE